MTINGKCFKTNLYYLIEHETTIPKNIILELK